MAHPRKAVILPLLAATLISLVLTSRPASAKPSVVESYGGRQMIVHVPDKLPPAGSRALVVVLHGGLGNADRIASRQAETGLNLDTVADRNGFIVVYLNGTPVTRRLGNRFLGWNSGGGCCGMAAENEVDDVAYIQGAVDELARRYGIDRSRVYAAGHSNGAMMAQRLVCETRLFAAVVAVSGPLNLPVSSCPAARGARILAIHGAEDQNVPVQGGPGSKGLSRTAFQSEARSKAVMTSSGAAYTLQIVPGADHFLDHIEAAIQKTEGVTIGEKAAAFFGLLRPGP
jgi:polyhydroxybutyrate depolymerase